MQGNLQPVHSHDALSNIWWQTDAAMPLTPLSLSCDPYTTTDMQFFFIFFFTYECNLFICQKGFFLFLPQQFPKMIQLLVRELHSCTCRGMMACLY